MSMRFSRLFAAAAVCAALLAPAYLAAQEPEIGARPATDGLPKSDAREIDWLELLPPEDLKALEEMPEVDHEGQMQMPQAMSSTKTVAAMDGVKGKVPGYLVPIAFDDQQRVTEMFLVPYFGACVHVPPPPANQLIHVIPDKPVPGGWNMLPVWVNGVMAVGRIDSDMGTAGYQLRAVKVEEYVEEQPKRR